MCCSCVRACTWEEHAGCCLGCLLRNAHASPCPLPLQVHLLGLGPAASFLPTLLQPPPPKAVQAALTGLQEVGAITLLPISSDDSSADVGSSVSGGSSSGSAGRGPGRATAAAAAGGGTGGDDADELQRQYAAAAGAGFVEVLTPLGRLLALLPLEPRLGKLLVMGAALGCLAPALVRGGPCLQHCRRMCTAARPQLAVASYADAPCLLCLCRCCLLLLTAADDCRCVQQQAAVQRAAGEAGRAGARAPGAGGASSSQCTKHGGGGGWRRGGSSSSAAGGRAAVGPPAACGGV